MHSSLSRSSHLIFLFAVASTGALRAQDTAPAALTLRDALKRAEQHSPALAALGFEERAAAALVEQASARPNPTLEFEAENFAGTGALRGVRGLEATVQASQTFERGGKREHRLAVASHERDLAVRQFSARRAEVLTSAALAFVEVVIAQQRVNHVAEPLKLAKEIAASTDRRVSAGESSAAEAARARAAVASAQAESARAEAELSASRAKLAAVWATPATDLRVVAGGLHVPDTLALEESFVAQLALHPRIAREQAVVESRRAALELERAHSVPDVTVGGGLRFLREGSDAGLVAGVSIPLPTRNKNQGAIRAARENLAGAEHKVRATEAELRAAFAAAWAEVHAAQAAVHSLRRDALPALEEAHALVRRAYQQGQATLADAFDTRRALVALQRDLFEAQASFVRAHVRAEALADSTFPLTAALLTAR